jgi:uncharacterized protein (TIGR03083 family)
LPDRLDHLALFERAAADLTAALADTDPLAQVPACPGWTVQDLALHVGTGDRWAASVLLSGRQQVRPDAVLRTARLPDWYAGTSAALAAAIRAVDPGEPCWNFAPVEQVAGFWSRRRLHETEIHLVDLVQAAGGERLPNAEVAADGVAEMFEVILPRTLERGFVPTVSAPLVVRASDTGDVWMLTPGATEGAAPEVARTAGPGEAVISGTAADLYLSLWKRAGSDGLRIEGDAKVAATFLEARLTP